MSNPLAFKSSLLLLHDYYTPVMLLSRHTNVDPGSIFFWFIAQVIANRSKCDINLLQLISTWWFVWLNIIAGKTPTRICLVNPRGLSQGISMLLEISRENIPNLLVIPWQTLLILISCQLPHFHPYSSFISPCHRFVIDVEKPVVPTFFESLQVDIVDFPHFFCIVVAGYGAHSLISPCLSRLNQIAITLW